MLHIYNYDEFWDQEKGTYAKYYNRQIKDAFDNIPPENLGKAIDEVEEIIKQTKIQNELELNSLPPSLDK